MALTGQRIRWTQESQSGPHIVVIQNKAIHELEEIPVERITKEDLYCTPSMHTMYRSLPGQINWLQSRTQFQCCYKYSRCASVAASPMIGDVKSLNKLARQIKSQPVKFKCWPLTGPLRILGFLDASYRNNDHGSSQRGMTVFLAESRERSSRDGMAYGSLTTKVRRLRRLCSQNLGSAARTILLPEQKETIRMISYSRKEACSGST